MEILFAIQPEQLAEVLSFEYIAVRCCTGGVVCVASIQPARAAQSTLQFVFLLLPASVLCLRALFDCGALVVYHACLPGMVLFSLFQSCLRLCNRMLAAFSHFGFGSLLLPSFGFTPGLLSLELQRRLARRLFADRL